MCYCAHNALFREAGPPHWQDTGKAVVRPVGPRHLCSRGADGAAVLQGAGGPQQLRKLRRQLTTQSGASMASTRSAVYSGGLNVRVDSMARSVDSDGDAHRPLLSGPRPSPVPLRASPPMH